MVNFPVGAFVGWTPVEDFGLALQRTHLLQLLFCSPGTNVSDLISALNSVRVSDFEFSSAWC